MKNLSASIVALFFSTQLASADVLEFFATAQDFVKASITSPATATFSDPFKHPKTTGFIENEDGTIKVWGEVRHIGPDGAVTHERWQVLFEGKPSPDSIVSARIGNKVVEPERKKPSPPAPSQTTKPGETPVENEAMLDEKQVPEYTEEDLTSFYYVVRRYVREKIGQTAKPKFSNPLTDKQTTGTKVLSSGRIEAFGLVSTINAFGVRTEQDWFVLGEILDDEKIRVVYAAVGETEIINVVGLDTP